MASTALIKRWLDVERSTDVDWEGPEELLRIHSLLHMELGADPSELLYSFEQRLSARLALFGIPHRHDDKLAREAGTYMEQPPDATLAEVRHYLQGITLQSTAVVLIQDAMGRGPIYVDVRAPELRGQTQRLLKAMNNYMPPGVALRTLNKGIKGDFATEMPAYQLGLGTRPWADVTATTWEVVLERIRMSAASSSPVFKSGQDPTIQVRVIKAAQEREERITTAVILEPGVLDRTVMNADGTPTGAEGDTYDEVQIQKAMYWWAENSRDLGVLHAVHGGFSVGPEDICLLENYQAPVDFELGGQQVVKGTWLQTHRHNNDGIWQAIKSGELTGWSVGMNMMCSIEEVPADVLRKV